tara:strand:+ start:154 stop:351 length:198 start_codon:yes stop_codon:yes gene_type:complete
MSTFNDTAEYRIDVIEFDNQTEYYEEEIEEEIETRNDIIKYDNKFVNRYEINDLVFLFKDLKIFC